MPQGTQHSALRLSRDGHAWSKSLIIESGVNAGLQLVKTQGAIVAFNTRYPDRHRATRHVVTLPDRVEPVAHVEAGE